MAPTKLKTTVIEKMLESIFGDISAFQIAAVVAAALLIGINKTGLPGIGLLPVLLLTLTIDPRLATGTQLTMLCTADLFAIAWYRRKGNWRLILKLLPSALAGLGIGHLIICSLNSESLMFAIGGIVLLLCIVSAVREFVLRDSAKIPSQWPFSIGMGLLAGMATQIANAAGPVMALYLLSMRLPKEEYMGTSAWYFMIMNWIKLPIFISEGRISMQSFYTDLAMLPFLLTGAALGILILRNMPRKLFDRVVLVLSALAAVYILLRPFLR